MKCFTLLKGAHASINGVMYKAGDIVASNHDCKKLWPTRFVEAPASSVPVKWDIRVNDVPGMDFYAVVGNSNGISFRVVDTGNKTVEGCSSMTKDNAIAKYFELMKKAGKDLTKKEAVAPLVPPTDEEKQGEEPKKGKAKANPVEEAEEEQEEEEAEQEEEAEEEEAEQEEEAPEEEEAEEAEEEQEEEEEEEKAPKKKVLKKAKKKAKR